MHPALVYLPGRRLSQSELSAARLDGHVVELGDAYIPADLVEGSELRAQSVRPLVPPGTAACGPSAAWIHGAGDAPPAVHHLKRSTDRRVRPPADGRRVFHDAALPPEDLVSLGGVAVSTPSRTMVDLATMLHRDPRMMRWMTALALAIPGVADEATAILRLRPRVPGRRAGIAALARVAVRTR